MDLSIIIVNWNTREMLDNCLSSIFEQNANFKVKVIVVDNASKDGSREMVQSKYPSVILINSGGNIGFGKANNRAKNIADTSLILFLNPDTIVVDNSIEKMANYLIRNPTIGAISCKMKDTNGLVQPLGLQWFPSPFTELISIMFLSQDTQEGLNSFLPYIDPNKSSEVSKLYGGCLMVRKTVLDQVGWFDERFFMYGEDVDLSRRIKDAGWKLYYLNEVEIIHICGGASGETTGNFTVLMTCESISKLMKKYYGNLGALLYRLVIFSGGNFRLLVISAMKILSSLYRFNWDIEYPKIYDKYLTIVKWSLYLKKPEIKT